MSEPSFASLLPVFVTLIVALTARNVLVGLFSGVFVGVAMVADASVLLFVPTLVRNFIVPEVADTYNASVLVLLCLLLLMGELRLRGHRRVGCRRAAIYGQY